MIIYYILTVIIYYAVWLACIFSAVHDFAILTSLGTFVITIVQIIFHRKFANNYNGFILSVLILFLVGCSVDTGLIISDLIEYKANDFYPLAPLWIMAIWFNFSTLYFITCEGLFKKPILLGILSLIGFPVAYYVGIAIGAAVPLSHLTLYIVGIIWAILLPIISLCRSSDSS